MTGATDVENKIAHRKTLGLIVGIDLVFGGWALIAVALASRTAKPMQT